MHAQGISRIISILSEETLPSLLPDKTLIIRLLSPKLEWYSSQQDASAPLGSKLLNILIAKRILSSSVHCLLEWVVKVVDLRLKFTGLVDMLHRIRDDAELNVRFCSFLLRQLNATPSEDLAYEIIRTAENLFCIK